MWYFKTRHGTVKIVPYQGRYHIIYNEDNLGSYISPQQAIDDAAGGYTSTPTNEVDLGDLGLPADIGEWQYSKVYF